MNIRSRFDFFLAKVAGRDIDIGTLIPLVAADATEELMLELSERLDIFNNRLNDVDDKIGDAEDMLDELIGDIV